MNQDHTLKNKSSEIVVLFDIDYTLFRTDVFKETNLTEYSLYTEVRDVLETIGQVATLGIFSEGELAFQKEKLLRTRINEYFFENCLHIVEKKDETLQQVLKQYKDKKLFLIDDKLPVLYHAKKYMPEITVVWIKRGYYADRQEPIKDFEPDVTVENLRDIISVIKK